MTLPDGNIPKLSWTQKTWDFLTPVISWKGAMSLTKLLAIAFAVADIRIMWLDKAISLNVLWMALACFSVAFGEKTFKFLLEKLSYSATGTFSETKTVAETIQKIEDRRKQGDGYEVTP